MFKEVVLKKSLFILLAITVLSLAIWYFFYLTLGDQLNTEETVLVVGISAVVVFSIRGVFRLLRRRGKKNE